MIHPDAAASKGCGCVLACALAVPAVQAILTGIHLSWLAVLVSPLHALCLLCILVIQWMWRHPAKEALMPLWQERAAALARSGRTGYNATLAALQETSARKTPTLTRTRTRTLALALALTLTLVLVLALALARSSARSPPSSTCSRRPRRPPPRRTCAGTGLHAAKPYP